MVEVARNKGRTGAYGFCAYPGYEAGSSLFIKDKEIDMNGRAAIRSRVRTR